MAVDLLFIAYWSPLVAGAIYPTPAGRWLEERLRIPQLVAAMRRTEGEATAPQSPRHRLLIGLILVVLAGFLLSAHSQYLAYRFQETTGSVACESASLPFDCTDIRDPDFNELLGVSVGWLGIAGFGILLFIAISLGLDPASGENGAFLLAALVLGGIGTLLAAWLAIVTLFLTPDGGVCHQCVSVHLAMFLSFGMIWRGRQLNVLEASPIR